MRALLLLTLFLPTAAMAECINDTEVFSCQIGEKTLLVCHWKGALIYSFGPANAPDLTIAEPLETVAYTPWPGFSRSIWSAVRFENKGISYEVWSSFDRMDENAVQEGGVTVLEGDVHPRQPDLQPRQRLPRSRGHLGTEIFHRPMLGFRQPILAALRLGRRQRATFPDLPHRQNTGLPIGIALHQRPIA
jgi:hypothetical protein